MDENTHNITIVIKGIYPHEAREYAKVMMAGDGGIDHMLDAFMASMMAAGFSLETVKKIGLVKDEN